MLWIIKAVMFIIDVISVGMYIAPGADGFILEVKTLLSGIVFIDVFLMKHLWLRLLG